MWMKSKTKNTRLLEQFKNPFEKIVENGKIDTSNTQRHYPLFTLIEHLGSPPVSWWDLCCLSFYFFVLCCGFVLFCLSSSCGFNVPNVVSVSWLAILECPFGFLSNVFPGLVQAFQRLLENRIGGGVIVSVLATGAVDRGCEPRSGQTKDYRIGICCFSAKQRSTKEKEQRLFDSG
jgi:hypothetical protein